MRLVVHMGATKTASTFLQKCFALNEPALRARGIYLPFTGRRAGSSTMNHHNLAWQLQGDRRFQEARGTWEALRTELRDVDAETVLLSSEAFARLASNPEKQSMLADRLSRIADDVTLVYVVRDPLSRINSMYTQAVKTFASPVTFDSYAWTSVRSGFYDLEQSFHAWYAGDRARFVAVRFDEFIDRGPLETILDIVGVEIPQEKLTVPDENNVSPGPLAVEGMRLLEARLRVLDPQFLRRAAATARLSMLAQRRADVLGWNDTRFWGWDAELAIWAGKRLRTSNERFARAVWGMSWPLELPLARQRTAVAVVDLPGKTRHRVDAFVAFMTRRYLHIRRQASKAGPETT